MPLLLQPVSKQQTHPALYDRMLRRAIAVAGILIRYSGRICRVKMCFGRGLILTRAPVAIRPKDILTVN